MRPKPGGLEAIHQLSAQPQDEKDRHQGKSRAEKDQLTDRHPLGALDDGAHGHEYEHRCNLEPDAQHDIPARRLGCIFCGRGRGGLGHRKTLSGENYDGAGAGKSMLSLAAFPRRDKRKDNFSAFVETNCNPVTFAR